MDQPPPPPRRLHNPNHPPPSPATRQADPYPAHSPPAQRPAQQPSYDPFPSRRDPFLPSSHGDRRDAQSSTAFWSGDRMNAPGHAPPPAPPSFATRNMPPPTSSPIQGSASNPSRPTLPTPPYAPPPSRDPHRKNMSISSIMASDQPALSNRPASSYNSRTPGPESFYASATYGPAPEEYAKGRGFDSAEQPAEGHAQRHTMQSPPAYGSPTNKGKPLTEPSQSRIPPRPYSQPSTFHSDHQFPAHPDERYHGRKTDSATIPRRTASDEDYEHVIERRDRAFSDLAGSRGPPQPLPPYPHPLHQPQPMYGPAPPPLMNGIPHGPQPWHPGMMSEPQHRDPILYHVNGGPPVQYGPVPPPPQPYGQLYGPILAPGDPRGHPIPYTEMHGPAFGPPYERKPEIGPPPILAQHSDDVRNRRVSVDSQLRKSIEDGQAANRALVGIGLDARRVDRSSPLPQAVQGASAQPVGSGRDPSIKSEFGRMFSGLGSGVGSTPQPITHPHGHPSNSPVNDDPEASYDMRRTASSGGRSFGLQRKRALDNSSEDGEGRRSPLASSRPGKKGRASYMIPPHHHHHSHGHHHHHHYPKRIEDDGNQAMPARQNSGTPVASHRHMPSQTNGASMPHHHHHHHTPHHHHHLPPRLPVESIPSMRMPSTIIRTKPLIEEVSRLPRKHLGSQIYSPLIDQPLTSTRSDGKFRFGLRPNRLRTFHGRENCTFTIRVARELLSREYREQVILQRRIWGTDVYTDDSDPVAAAIHSGWIRGAWSEEIDEEMILGKPREWAESQPAADMLEPPEHPVAPPGDKDAHVTLLLLPPLENYSPTTWHGIRSRKWGNNHDGMSFRIHAIRWVEELGSERFVERGSEARRQRMKRRATAAGYGEKSAEQLNGFIDNDPNYCLSAMRSTVKVV